jgi:4-amino-4-deoxy-L-arabinose transferase-like glycosyltransferase
VLHTAKASSILSVTYRVHTYESFLDARQATKSSLLYPICLAILAASLLFRAVYPDADPPALISRDCITDEGQWAHNARNALLFGKQQMDEYNPGLYSAYIYNALLYFSLNSFGLTLTALRLPSIILGWLTVVLLLLIVWREGGPRRSLFAAALLGFSNLHIIYSRTAFAESTLTFFLALALWLWTLKSKHPCFAFMSGAAFILMCLAKVTAIYVLPGILLLAAAEAVTGRLKRQQVLLFLVGGSLVIAAYALFFIAANFEDWLHYNLASGMDNEWPNRTSDLIRSIQKLLGSRFYAKAPLFTALSLLVVASMIIHASKHGLERAISRASSTEVIGCSLLIGYLFSVAFTIYQPERRFIPALLPMAMLSASFLDRGFTSLKETLSREERIGAVGWLVILLPPFVLVQALLFSAGILALKLAWFDINSPSGIWFWLFKILPLMALAWASLKISRASSLSAVRKKLLSASWLTFILIFSILALVPVFNSLLLFGLSTKASFKTIAIAAAVYCGLLFTAYRSGIRLSALLLCSSLIIEGAQITTWLLQPTYTIKQANQQLAQMIKRGETVVTHYETVLLSSSAKVVTYWPKAGFNANAYERFNPNYILILRRDNWKDLLPGEMPADEWPPPPGISASRITSFNLCPVPRRGPRFVLELYGLK